MNCRCNQSNFDQAGQFNCVYVKIFSILLVNFVHKFGKKSAHFQLLITVGEFSDYKLAQFWEKSFSHVTLIHTSRVKHTRRPPE